MTGAAAVEMPDNWGPAADSYAVRGWCATPLRSAHYQAAVYDQWGAEMPISGDVTARAIRSVARDAAAPDGHFWANMLRHGGHAAPRQGQEITLMFVDELD